ncbi:beta-N-acetylhexosaminidase [Paenibacillus filicis]|uniref:beta-N-acetylhexosaminidase n=1 Tax=Paenibacillus gyeongsangnamensis TaxID=3388067 RepID=A0ABT4QBK3_9BACL|nr:beta-N-acetylhexosaminidase [Paenibacillus filicis]MCZ8514060.1 beta-N-acetylhexosaminidase [Paenibacillus filicis]
MLRNTPQSLLPIASALPALVTFLLLTGCSGQGSPGTEGTAKPQAPPSDPVRERLTSLTLDQKLGQLLIAGIDGDRITGDMESLIKNDDAGGIIFYKDNLKSPAQALQLFNALKEANKGSSVPLWLSLDEEGGRVSRMPGELVKMPSARTIGLTDNRDASYGVGRALGGELSAFGLNLNFAPVLDVNSNPNNPVIGDRSFGADAAVVGRNGTAELQGLQSQGVIPVVKHFPGHGDTSVDSHIGLPVLQHDLTRLRSLELKPFAEAIRGGADAVMVAHILLPKLDPENPASFSKPVITDLLRKELGFGGVVMTDDLTMGAVVKKYELGEAAVRSLEAGGDVLLVGHGYDLERQALQAVKEAVRSGRLTERRIDESVYRILQLKAKYKLTDEPKGQVEIARVNEALKQAVQGLKS